MRKAVLTILFVTLLSGAHARDGQNVFEGVTDYFRSIVAEPVDSIIVKVDSIIAQAAPLGAEKQAAVAGLAFDFFNTTPLMGLEAVSVHVADNYFLNGKLKWSDESTYPTLYSFAEFNRASLIGKPAPELRMEGIDSIWVSMRNVESQYKVLYFYEPQCATCRKETPALVSFAAAYSGPPITVFAVYTQADHDAWYRYVGENFALIDNPDINFVHVWDPELQSDFQKKYGVVTTPSMFLLDDQNIIIGRKLDTDALEKLLQMKVNEKQQYVHLFDKVFNSMKPLHAGDADVVTDAFASRTMADTSLFRLTMYNLFQYYRNAVDYELQQGAFTLAEKYIAGYPEYWSDEYVRLVIHQLELEKMNPVGSFAPDVILYDMKGRRRSLLDCSMFNHLIMFHLIDCDECRKEIEDLRAIESKLYLRDVSVTLVYVGTDFNKWKEFTRRLPSRWRFLWDPYGKSGMRVRYDLESVPHTYFLDGSDMIVGKNFKISTIKFN